MSEIESSRMIPVARGSEVGAAIREMAERKTPVARVVFAILVLCGLLMASFWIMFPFLGALIWAGTIVIATWPLLLRVQKRLRGSRALATTAMTLGLLGVFFVPFLIAVGTLLGNKEDITAKLQWLIHQPVPPPPAWVSGVPLVGRQASEAWTEFAGNGAKDFAALLTPYANDLVKWLMAKAGGLGAFVGQFLLTAIVAAVLYANGEKAARKFRLFGRKLADERGEAVIVLAAQAVRGVAFGVVLTALGQAVLTGVGLAVAGIRFPVMLAVIAFILCIAQIGPLLVLAPCVFWLYSTGHSGWGTFLLIWTLVVGLGDNIVRPMLIKKGADLPLLLIFTGVIGGLLTMGLIGIFVGPVVLAVAHTLLHDWLESGTADVAG